MSAKNDMGMLLKLPGSDYQEAIVPYELGLKPYIDKMGKSLTIEGPLPKLQAFRDYAVYCRWPIRQLEYSFAIRCLPSEPDGPFLDVGSGVTPWPHFVADRGWPTVAIDVEVDQVAAMRRQGIEMFGSAVDHRVADVRGLGFSNGLFSAVSCVSVLEHLQHTDIPVALAEMVRVCRPGGRIILTTDIYANDDPGIPTGQGAFPVKTLEHIFSPLARACRVEREFRALIDDHCQLSSLDLEKFWTEHWQPGLWQEKNRGYGAVGMIFDLPDDPADCQALVGELRTIASEMAYPPSDKPYHQVHTPDGAKLWMIGDEVLTQGMTSEEFERDIRNFFEHFLREGDTVFDVGANVGLYTVLFSRLVGHTGQVHAFEPSGQTFGCLVRNTLLCNNVRLNRAGISDQDSPLKLLHAKDNNSSLNSFGEPFGAGNAAGDDYVSEDVWVTTLDQYIRDYSISNVDLLKVDVEGWEERVLRAGVGALLTMAPVLTLEYCSPAARNANSSCAAISGLLKTVGYDLFRYDPDTRSLEPVEYERDAWQYANLIAIKRSALPYVISRLRGEQLASELINQADTNGAYTDRAHMKSYDSSDILHLLEENRSLRQRLTAHILDKEVTALYHQLQTSEAESAARLDIIQRLDAQVSEQQAAFQRLQERLTAAEADRAARLDVIQRLQAQRTTAEAEAVAHLDAIQRLNAQVSEQQAAFQRLQERLTAAEADRAARLDVIQSLQTQLAAVEADRAARLDKLLRQDAAIQKLQAELTQARASLWSRARRRLKSTLVSPWQR